jgi:hypothetical protein
MATATNRGFVLGHVTNDPLFPINHSYFQINHWMVNVLKFHYEISVLDLIDRMTIAIAMHAS